MGGMILKLRETLDIAAKAMGRGAPIPDEVKKGWQNHFILHGSIFYLEESVGGE